MPLSPWKLLEKSLLLSALPWLEVYKETVEVPGGRILEDFYRVVLPEFAVVVPVTDQGDLVMVRSYKHGLGRVSLTAPAGMLNPGESPLEAAKRELLEETGCSASEWEVLGTFVVDGNRQCGTGHLYLARHVKQVAPARQADPNEAVEVELVRPDRFLDAVREGDVALFATMGAVCLALLTDEYLKKKALMNKDAGGG